MSDPNSKARSAPQTETQSRHVDATLAPNSVAPSRAFLLVEHDGTMTTAQLRVDAPVVLGRAPSCEIRVDSRSLSREHARFVWVDGRVRVDDLGSKNGVIVNGVQVQSALVVTDDVVALGDVVVRVHIRNPPISESVAGEVRPLSIDAWRRRLDEEIERARIFKRSVAVVALRGSEEEARQVPARLRGLTRPIDALTRYSPRVWLLVLVETPRPEAETRAQALRKAMSEKAVVGVSTFPEASSADALMGQALDALRPKAQASAQSKAESSVIADPRMLRVYETVARVARATLPVLVLGETGVGKELVARALHEQSSRAGGPFRAVNCGAIAENLIESELFGHERGAFTGADAVRAGVFEQAHHGTLFLDEVGELSPHAQASLLRVLETRRVVRVGGAREIDVDVRVVAATHRDLSARVRDNAFRADLWYRLEGLVLEIPPLRERPLDLQPLCAHFLESIAKDMGIRPRELSQAAQQALGAYSWPGNVRQLRNVLERACIVCLQEQIEVTDLPDAIAQAGEPGDDLGDEHNLTARVRAYESRLIRQVLSTTQGNLSEAARRLGIPRRTLAYRIQVLELE